MPLKPSVRLPRRFNRPVTKQTKRFVSRRHQRRKDQRRERLRRTARRMQRVAGDWRIIFQKWVMLTLACFFLFFAGLIVFSPIVQVREIRVQRTNVRIDAEKVQRALAPIFGRHLLFLSTQDVTELLRTSVPDVGEIGINKDYPSRITVRMTLEPITARLVIVSPDPPPEEAIPEELALNGSGSAIETAGQDFLTVNGRYIVHPSPAGLGDLPVLTIVDWGVRPGAGQLLVPPDFLQAIYSAEETLREQFGWETSERVVYIRAREFHLDTQKLALWFDLKSPLPEQFARFKLFLQSIPEGEAKEYVDLRLSDRIVYK
ncbi:hypothetical protein HYZ99_01710 [Candidatus Peregrinibacteria bacterium]|nr:hypothetical protein [Candidatus Peregrinibacteria bacterium]